MIVVATQTLQVMRSNQSWKSRMTEVEQMHMLASAGINPNNSDIEFESSDEKHYQKKLKNALKARASAEDA